MAYICHLYAITTTILMTGSQKIDNKLKYIPLILRY